MVRGLVIRQLFLVLNLVLVGLILYASFTVALQLVKPPLLAEAAPLELDGGSKDSATIVRELRERSVYGGILDNGLFGAAGRFDPVKVVEEPVVEEVADGPEEETKLSLKLWAVTSLSPTSPFAAASIEDTMNQAAGSQLFHVGNMVVENVTLEEVHPRWVVLLNRRENPPVRERLSMDEEEGDGAAAAQMASRMARPTVLPGSQVELDKGEFIEQLRGDYTTLVTTVKPELYRDASGKVAGITAQNISDVPLATQLGLENGDVLQTVNNEQIDSEQKILEMIQKYQNADSFRIGVMRNGKQKVITYNFR